MASLILTTLRPCDADEGMNRAVLAQFVECAGFGVAAELRFARDLSQASVVDGRGTRPSPSRAPVGPGSVTSTPARHFTATGFQTVAGVRPFRPTGAGCHGGRQPWRSINSARPASDSVTTSGR